MNNFQKIPVRNFDEVEREKALQEIIRYAENVAGNWNGDNPGVQEDNAHIANEIIEKCNDVLNLLNEIK